jgi:hypothetical protein
MRANGPRFVGFLWALHVAAEHGSCQPTTTQFRSEGGQIRDTSRAVVRQSEDLPDGPLLPIPGAVDSLLRELADILDGGRPW